MRTTCDPANRWTRHTLAPPGIARDSAAPDQRAFLLFEAVANFSEVWIDGRFVGGRDGGFLSFRLDITDALAEDDNHVVAIRADNAPRLAAVPPDPID